MSAIGMPPELLALFALAPNIVHEKRKGIRCFSEYSGVKDFLQYFETENSSDAELTVNEKEEQKQKKAFKQQAVKEELAVERAKYLKRNFDDQKLTMVPENTIFIGRLSYATSVETLYNIFESCGPIRDIRLVQDLNNCSRGYAFLEFENLKSVNKAIWTKNKTKIDGFTIVVDKEKSRTQKNWFPMRLGGGVGYRRAFKLKKRVLRMRRKAVRAQQLLQSKLNVSQRFQRHRKFNSHPLRKQDYKPRFESNEDRENRYSKRYRKTYN